MSIFDRLIATLSGHGAQEPATVVKTEPPSPEAPAKAPARFMGREDESSSAAAVPVPEPGLSAPAQLWLYICPNSQRLLLVSAMGEIEGQELSVRMQSDLRRAGLCEGLAYRAGYDQYWKMPSHDAMLRMPAIHHLEMLPPNQVKLSTQLVKPGEAKGCWMRVRMREVHELRDEPQIA